MDLGPVGFWINALRLHSVNLLTLPGQKDNATISQNLQVGAAPAHAHTAQGPSV